MRRESFARFQANLRGKRFRKIEQMLRSILETKQAVTVLDSGGRAEYWNMLPHDLRPQVRVTTLNFESELELYDRAEPGLQVENVVGDACSMPQYGDGSFDLVHSNSVIEHVGSFQNMRRFAEEVRRVGNAYYVQTPSLWFPIDPHYGVPFIHWMPDPVRVGLFSTRKVGFAGKRSFDDSLVAVDHTRIISRYVLEHMFQDATILRERFMLLTKSITAVREYVP